MSSAEFNVPFKRPGLRVVRVRIEGAMGDFASITAARDEAMSVIREIVGTVVKNGDPLNSEAVIVADEYGTLAALPVAIVDLLKPVV
jgi:hypothetical protein